MHAVGAVPVEAERVLCKIIEVSLRVAECVCVTAKRHGVPPSDFVRVFDQLLQLTCEGRFIENPTMIEVRRMTVSKVIPDRRERVELTERINAVDRYLVSEDPQIHLAELEFGCDGLLLDHRWRRSNHALLITSRLQNDEQLGCPTGRGTTGPQRHS
jgi:hypothetical protein